MNTNETPPADQSPEGFIAGIEPTRRREDGLRLLTFFQEVSGFAPVMWGPSMIGYGRYHYVYDSGREGDYLATGFSPRKAALSVYIMPGYQNYDAILGRLGKHKLGRSCLYINKLDDIDMDVLAELIRTGLKDLDARWRVHPA